LEHETVYHGYTSEQGIAEFQVNAYGGYKVKVEAPSWMNPRVATRWVTLDPHKIYELYFIFNMNLFIPVKRTEFYLTDQNYINLPISKGELYLCQDLM